MSKPETPQDLGIPSFLMCPPFHNSFSNDRPNNPLMTGKENISYEKAFRQWIKVYQFLSRKSLVYLLPNEGTFQDQVYVANLGIALSHTDKPTFIASNFTSTPRRGEEKVGLDTFGNMHYKSIKCPYHFEGEADLKYIRTNKYIGGFGIRSQLHSYQWMEDRFNCNITPVEMTDQKLYHFECVFFPVNDQQAIVTVSALKPVDIRKIEKVVEIIEMPAKFAYEGMTNLVRLGNNLLCRDIPAQQKLFFDSLCRRLGLEPAYFPLEEFNAGGADLSCLIMHINRINYKSNVVSPLGLQVKEFLS